MDYPGKVITKTQVTPTQTSASGNWTLDDQAAAIKNNNWPVALVPNPISKSLRFNSADSAYLNRTPASDTSSNKKGTFSCWMKVSSNSGTNGGTFLGAADNYHYGQFYSESLYFGNSTSYINTAAVFRDFSAWYHVFFVFDTTLATANDRMQIWVNGVRQAVGSFNTQPTQNASFVFLNTAQRYDIGRRNTGNYFNGYLTEINFVDGQALTPSDFGLTNPQTGQWIPKKYTGTYGTNGFYLNFKDATSTTTLGYDYSGNANNWTTNNFSVTAGVNNDSFTDVPTPWIAYNTVDSGGVVRGNYCTLNPLVPRGASTTFSNGNLTYTNTAGSADQYVFEGWNTITSQYYECTATTVAASSLYIYAGDNAGYYCSNGQIYINGSLATTVATYTSGDVLGFAVTVGGVIRFYKNGTLLYTSSGIAAGSPLCNGFSSTVWNFNFGQRSFNSTPPAGYKSLCTTNLPATTIGFGLTNQGDDYFNTVLWTGNATARSITGVGFQPDFVWIKNRTSAFGHLLYDVNRGTGLYLASNSTAADTSFANGLTSFDSDGFGVGTASAVNENSSGLVAWNWKAGGTGVSNTAGTVTSTVSANTTARFSVVTYTGTGVAATVGHGLGVAPSMIIVKDRDDAGTNWCVYHVSLGNGNRVLLNLTNASAATGNWNSTSPTSSVFSIGVSSEVSANNKQHVAYCFAAVAGYSAFGSYTGNGSTDGPFVYTGFRPRYLLVKNASDGTANAAWIVIDSARSDYNQAILYLVPNTSGAEASSTGAATDFLSNGFKIRNISTAMNANTNTIIYAAFAEFPFQFANAR